MSRLFYQVMQDNLGNLLFDVSGTMRLAGTGTLATIYGDEALTVVLPNPMTNHPSFASFKCFLGAGDYDFYMAKAGYTFETLTGVQGHGTMAQQNAHAVAITGGTIAGVAQTGGSINGAGITGGIISAVTTIQGGFLGVNRATISDIRAALTYTKASEYGMLFTNGLGDTGRQTILFQNAAAAVVGSIDATASATSYNTSSDGRLKEAIAPLPQALETIQRLLPVEFRWKATGERGQGFIAQDVQAVVPQAVSGSADDPEPTMQMDHSKLVVWLVGACQELAQQVQVLSARLAAVEGA